MVAKQEAGANHDGQSVRMIENPVRLWRNPESGRVFPGPGEFEHASNKRNDIGSRQALMAIGISSVRPDGSGFAYSNRGNELMRDVFADRLGKISRKNGSNRAQIDEAPAAIASKLGGLDIKQELPLNVARVVAELRSQPVWGQVPDAILLSTFAGVLLGEINFQQLIELTKVDATKKADTSVRPGLARLFPLTENNNGAVVPVISHSEIKDDVEAEDGNGVGAPIEIFSASEVREALGLIREGSSRARIEEGEIPPDCIPGRLRVLWQIPSYKVERYELQQVDEWKRLAVSYKGVIDRGSSHDYYYPTLVAFLVEAIVSEREQQFNPASKKTYHDLSVALQTCIALFNSSVAANRPLHNLYDVLQQAKRVLTDSFSNADS